MDYNSPDFNSWPAKLVMRISRKLRSEKAFTQKAIDQNNAKAAARREQRRLQHAKDNNYVPRGADQPAWTQQGDINELGERDYSVFSDASTLVPQQDHTEMMHGLAHRDSFDSLNGDKWRLCKVEELESAGPWISTPEEALIARIPSDVWKRIATLQDPFSAASLSLASQTLHQKLGSSALKSMNRPVNKKAKTAFLLATQDGALPGHLFCFACTTFHARLNPGQEKLKANFNTNPLVICPNARNTYLPRTRLTHGRELPYSFVQLALRHERFSPAHGLSAKSLSRRWTSPSTTPDGHTAPAWTHATRYMTHGGHLLFRCTSSTPAPPAATSTETSRRHLLYSTRDDYSAYFSVCAHWRDGELMDVCKCALSHVPAPPESYAAQLRKAPRVSRELARPNFLVRGCDFCRPARRCPQCPTEYLVEVQMVEDRQQQGGFGFRHSIVVTRWSDLGDGSGPLASVEWRAINGLKPGLDRRYEEESKSEENHAGDSDYEGKGDEKKAVESEEDEKEYVSFSQIGRRAVSGIFESQISGSVPGERMLSLNPKNQRLGEEGHGWY